MRFENRSLPIMIALLVIASVTAPAVVAADHGALDVTATQNEDGSVLVTVLHNDTSVAGANVTVEAAANETYDGAGDYNTDENGTVTLVAPSEDVNVTISAENDSDAGSTDAFLIAPDEENDISISVSQDADYSVTIAVTDNGSAANGSVTVEAFENESYVDSGTHTLDNGSVELSAPNETVNVTVTADTDNGTATTTATLSAGLEQGPDLRQIGKWISSLAGSLPEDADHRNFGQYVSEFVHSVKDNFTPPGLENKADNGNGNGHGPKDNGSHGPPEHANNDDDDDEDEKN